MIITLRVNLLTQPIYYQKYLASDWLHKKLFRCGVSW